MHHPGPSPMAGPGHIPGTAQDPGLPDQEVQGHQWQLLRDLWLRQGPAQGRDLLRSGRWQGRQRTSRRVMKTDTLRMWDPLVRLFHWSLAGAFIGNYFFTEEGEDWHRWLGYYAVAWLVIRLLWGFIGSPAARWSDFWPTRTRLVEHGRALLGGRPYHRLGHSPIGALVMLLMMALMLGLGVSGFLMEEIDYFWGADLPEELHEF